MNAIFTIVAKNYIGLAEVLARSIFEHNKDINLYVFIADEYDTDKLPPKENGINYCIAKDHLNIPQEKWYEMAFKYDLTEFCTAIKPKCFEYIFSLDIADKVLYFDPDIMVVNPLDDIFQELEDNFVVVTPHIVTIEDNYSGDTLETNILGAGIYNLGFIGLKRSSSSHKMLSWWSNRLYQKCYRDKFDNVFTDQKWMDFLPAYFKKGVFVSYDLGRNLAPWNFYEREIYTDLGITYVKNRLTGTDETKLLFVHFSGFNYTSLAKANQNIPGLDLSAYKDLEVVLTKYKNYLGGSTIVQYFNLTYSYNYFSNNDKINRFQRRLFRRFTDDSLILSNPFSTEGTFYNELQKHGLLLNDKSASQDSLNERSFIGFTSYLKKINFCMLLVKKVIGFKRYALLSKFLIRYFRPENQIFLYNKKYMESSFKSEYN